MPKLIGLFQFAILTVLSQRGQLDSVEIALRLETYTGESVSASRVAGALRVLKEQGLVEIVATQKHRRTGRQRWVHVCTESGRKTYERGRRFQGLPVAEEG